ncbi:MAG: glycosyltransferase, partial [Armatimonadetes bacterium]|nr:glycosyltransferase [Armatimonadota bacterium]
MNLTDILLPFFLEKTDIAGLLETCRANKLSAHVADLNAPASKGATHHDLFVHKDALHRYTVPQIHALLASQVTLNKQVAFRVPTARFPAERATRGERLLTLEQWRETLAPFKVEEFLPLGENEEHLCVVLKGQKPAKALRALIADANKPFPFGISVIVHTRNEAHNIGECLPTVLGWTDEIVVCDMESEDDTVAIARQFTDRILPHPHIPNFDSARNASAIQARFRWVLYIDADERVPQGLGEILRSLLEQEGDSYSALLVPYRNLFLGHWLDFLSSVYKATGFFKNGRFWFDPRPHAGAQVDGETRLFTPQHPHQRFIHLAYRDLHHYLEKYNAYTDTEANNRFAAGGAYQWQTATRAFGLYRWTEQAKLFEKRFQAQTLQAKERGVPRNTREMLEFALQALDEIEAKEAKTKSLPAPVSNPTRPIAVRWEGAQLTWHSLAHVNRELCLALLKTNQVELSLLPTQPDLLTAKEYPQFQPLAERHHAPLSRPAEVHIRHSFPPNLTPPPPEGHFVLIQAWEYGSLPKAWIPPILNTVSEVWCYSEYVRSLYRDAGVPEERLALVPLGVDTQTFHPQLPPYPIENDEGGERLRAQTRERGRPFVFLFVGGTLWRKGIDILLAAYLSAFTPQDNVCLVIKDMGTRTFYLGMNYREKIRELLSNENLPSIVYTEDDLSPERIASLYATAGCVVQPYRGEGFCLPALEAMACGTPVIVPAGGPTDDFVDESVGWRLPAAKRPLGGNRVDTWECVGETWMFEVNPSDLARQMREVFENREEAKRRGENACKRVQERWTWNHAAEIVLKRLHALRDRPPLPPRKQESIAPPLIQSLPVRAPSKTTQGKGGLRISRSTALVTPLISVCMIVKNEERVLGDCLATLKAFAGEVIIVDTGS